MGQQFYTPDDITIPDLIPTDRPYAGWLYVGGSWRASTYDKLVATDVYLAAIGDSSLAEPTQKAWHRLVGAKEPRGWDHQIGDRFGIVVGHNRRRAFEALSGRDLRWLEVVPYVGGTVGNIMVDAYAGARVKIGYNISRDWSQLGISPRILPQRRSVRADPGKLELYAVVDAQGRALAYNALIDAAPNHQLTRNNLVSDGGVGVGFRFGRLGVSYRVAFVSPEYEEALVHDYKALRFTFTFAG